MSDDNKSELDRSLEAYLKQQSDDKQKGYTIAHLHTQMHEFLITVRRHERKLDGHEGDIEELQRDRDEANNRLDAHRDGILGIKRVLKTSGHGVDQEFREEMDTGNFDLASIRREVADQKAKRLHSERVKAEEVTWWKRNLISLVLGAFGVVATALFSILITLAIAGATSKAVPSVPVQQNQK
jgi:hypothetical protein